MGQCLSSSSNEGVAPEPPTAVPMVWHIRFNTNEDGLEISMTGNFIPGTFDMCVQKYVRYVEIEHLDHVEAT
ncbi:hypothetical protein Tco_0573751 [Tanacetum coccineum]